MLNSLFSSFNLKKFTLKPFEPLSNFSNFSDFLNSTSILSFTDLNGQLMAARPDVTLSIIRRNLPGDWFYNESVFRPDQNHQSFQQVRQAGIELLGDEQSSRAADIALACLEFLAEGRNFILDVADAGLVSKLISSNSNSTEWLKALSSRNIDALPPELANLLKDPPDVNFDFIDNPHVNIDYSAVSNIKYYNGLVFKGYIEGCPDCVLSGGQYDGLLRAVNSPIEHGVGFAVYLDRLEVEDD